MGSYCSQLTIVCSTPPAGIYVGSITNAVLLINFINANTLTYVEYITDPVTKIVTLNTSQYNYVVNSDDCTITRTIVGGNTNRPVFEAATLKMQQVGQLYLSNFYDIPLTLTKTCLIQSSSFTGNYKYTPEPVSIGIGEMAFDITTYITDSYYGDMIIDHILIYYILDIPYNLEIFFLGGRKFVSTGYISLGSDCYFTATMQSFNTTFNVKFKLVGVSNDGNKNCIQFSQGPTVKWDDPSAAKVNAPTVTNFTGSSTTDILDTTGNLPANCVPSGYYTATNNQDLLLSITITDSTHLTYSFFMRESSTYVTTNYIGNYSFTVNNCLGLPIYISGSHGDAIEQGFTVGPGGTTISINSYYNDGGSLVFTQRSDPQVPAANTGTFIAQVGSSAVQINNVIISPINIYVPGVGLGDLIQDASDATVFYNPNLNNKSYQLRTGKVATLAETANGTTTTYNLVKSAVSPPPPPSPSPRISPSTVIFPSTNFAPSVTLVSTFRLRYGDYTTGIDENGNGIYLTGSINLYSDGSIVGGGSKYTVDSTGAVNSGINSDNSDYISSLMNQWSAYTGVGTVTLYYLTDQATSRNTNPKSSTTLINAIDSTGAVTLYFATFY